MPKRSRGGLVAGALITGLLAACAGEPGPGRTATGPSPTTTAPARTASATDRPEVTPQPTVRRVDKPPPSRSGAGAGSVPALTLERVVRGLDFPTFAVSPPGDPRLFVTERSGVIRILRGGRLLDRPFLDLSRLTRTDGERGLLGLAFHPDYRRDRRFFVHYSGAEDGDSRLVEYRASADADRADPASARLLLNVEQPAGNHNGGMVAFGPDGYLYLGLGDGGGAGDTFEQGQNPKTLLATLVRIDVDRREDGKPYAIPPDNPFTDGRRGAPEVWAYGLRNPWRFSFDQGLIYIGDVGQRNREEIDVEPADVAGLNYGWPILEGSACYRPRRGCDRGGLVAPVFEYGSGEGGTCGVIGGFVYRGRALPELAGTYFYGDLCAGWIRSLRYDRGHGVTDRRQIDERVDRLISFGQDAAGEVYALDAGGAVYRIVAAR